MTNNDTACLQSISSMMVGNPVATNNLKVIKKLLTDPQKFKDANDYFGKACFSQGYKKYGCFETWEIALEKLNNLPINENIFNELITENSKVKPYLDIEWIRDKYPEYIPEKVILAVKEKLIVILQAEWNYKLLDKDIYITSCHRKKNEGYKYSYHVIISSHPSIVFVNANCASILARKLRTACKPDFNEDIIDMGVYGKTQNIRLVHHSKSGEFIPFQKHNIDDDDLEYIITNTDPVYSVMEVPEQRDYLYKGIKNINKLDFSSDDNLVKELVEKIQKYHPTASIERIDASGFIQFNYTDRAETCFSDDKTLHERIGFFVYIYNNSIYLGCHSGNCVNADNSKCIINIGSLDVKKNLSFEKVDFDNSFDIDSSYVQECIMNGAIGLSNLFERMYLEPKRIKWIDETKLGTSYFWDGKFWQEDNYSFIERLIAITTVRQLRKYIKESTQNKESNVDEAIIENAQKMVIKLNDGVLLNQISRFVKPLIRDTEFSKVKDIHPYMLSCKNGMIDLKTGELRHSVPEDNITKSLEICFDPNANSSDFDKFVKQITSNEEGEDPELYNFLKWTIGYALQGAPSKKIFIVLYGKNGYNGKSMVLNIIKDVLGHYSVSMDKSVVLDGPKKTAGSHSTEIMQLENCRIGILSETQEEAVLDDAQVKMLTGITDKLSAREIYGKQKEFSPVFVPFISSNHKIKMNLSDNAMYERLMLIEFKLSFVDNPGKDCKWERKADNLLAEKFQKNKEGVLKWLVDASVFYHKNMDLKVPKSMIDAKLEYKKELNSCIDFLSRVYIQLKKSDYSTSPEYKKDILKYTIPCSEVLQEYKEYCKDNKIAFLSKNAEKEFDILLEHSNSKRDTKKYYGLKIRDDDELESVDLIDM